MPNISILMMSVARGQFVTPANMAVMPMAAEKDGSRCNNGPTTQPNVAPTKKEGTISPPLNPHPRVMAVNTIFMRKAAGNACPFVAFVMMFPPAPR